MKYYIYKISDNNNIEEFYIGSTNKFSTRKSSHKKAVNNKSGKKYWCKLYQYIRANGGWENFTMSVVHEAETEEKKLIKEVEQQYIETLKPTLNSSKAFIKKVELINI